MDAISLIQPLSMQEMNIGAYDSLAYILHINFLQHIFVSGIGESDFRIQATTTDGKIVSCFSEYMSILLLL